MGSRTALFERHRALGAKIVDFAGWEMPLHYGSQVDEHHAVRSGAGLFDVSHMTVVDVDGNGACDFLRRLLANDVAKLDSVGRALYSCMLNETGGVLDDLIVYARGDKGYRVVVNAATRDKDLAWIGKQAAQFDVNISERADLAMLAVQGPNARELTLPCLSATLAGRAAQLKPFFAAWEDEIFVARTGYTGEDGFEIILPDEHADSMVAALLANGVVPAGLGARDTLRLEAGMNLYGADMDQSVSPLESGLAWTVAFAPEDRDFIGRSALQSQRANGVARKLVGLVLDGRGVMRNHQQVECSTGNGEVTSGSYSPTLGRSIAFARVPADSNESVRVEIRKRLEPARVVKPPFVRNGRSCID